MRIIYVDKVWGLQCAIAVTPFETFFSWAGGKNVNF